MTTTQFVTDDAADWVQCHGATLVATPAGEVLVAFFAGTAEGTADTTIRLVRGTPTDDAATDWAWSRPQTVSAHPRAHWNPVLAWSPPPRQDLVLFYKMGAPISAWRTMIRRSGDEGRTWSAASELVAGDVGGRGPVKNPPVVVGDGTWVAGASLEGGARAGATTRWDAFADVSSDAGRTWHRSVDFAIDHTTFAGPGVIQPTLWAAPGRGEDAVTALLRTTSGLAWRTDSDDAGATWSVPEPTDLPNNNSGLCPAALPDGRVVVAHNPSDVPWGPRNELVLSVSDDDGRHFTSRLLLDELPPPQAGLEAADAGVITDGVGELSYPTVVLDGSRLLVSYTWQRRRIALATIDLTELS